MWSGSIERFPWFAHIFDLTIFPTDPTRQLSSEKLSLSALDTSVTSLHVGLLVLHAWVSKKTNQKPSFWALTKIHLDSQMNDKGCLIPQSLAENILSKYNLPKTREKRNKHVSWDGMCEEWYKNVRWMEVLERQKYYESIIRPFRLHQLIVPPLISLHFVSKSLYVDEDSTAKNLYFSIIFSERLDYECDLPWTPGKCRTDQSKTSYFSKQIFSKVWSLENRTFWRLSTFPTHQDARKIFSYSKITLQTKSRLGIKHLATLGILDFRRFSSF